MKFYENAEFKALKAKWYDKLEKSGFIDEESGKGYSGSHDHGYLRKSEYILRARLSNNNYLQTYEFYHDLLIFSSLPSLTPYFPANYRYNLKILRKIAQLYGEGASLANISKHLRRYYKAPKRKLGRKGKPYSIFWCHSRLKELLSAVSCYNCTVNQDESIADEANSLELHRGG